MMNPNLLIGKPLVVYIDGERRVIGEVTNAAVRGDKLYFGASVTIGADESEDLRDLMEQT